jgi:type III pantothenate kinase
MHLSLDIGNSQIHGGFYSNDKLLNDFRLNTKQGWSSDQLGIFFTSFCREYKIDYTKIKGVAICSVVPSMDYHLKNASIKYFKKEPFFIKSGVKTGILVDRFKNPQELGADLICAAVSGASFFPEQDLLIVDMGTATTIIAISAKKEFLGGVIIPGIITQIDSLSGSAEKLFTVEIMKPTTYLGKTTIHSIQSGIYYGHLGSLKYLLSNLEKETFGSGNAMVIATGGFSRLYNNEGVFNKIIPELILRGALQILKLNL